MIEPKYTVERAYATLAKRCSIAEKCSGDISKKLREWGFSADVAKQLVGRLIDERYISDERYCRAYIRDKSQLSGWGKQKIRTMLLSKGVNRAIIESALLELIDKESEEQQCATILQKKLRSTKYSNKYDLRNKLMRFGASRGYSFEQMERVIYTLIKDID